MRTANSLPPCRPHSRPLAALYVIPAPDALTPGRFALVSERCFARDSEFVVRRGGRLVPAGTVDPVPNAIQMLNGSVHEGFNGHYPSLRDFAADNGCDPAVAPLGVEALKRRPDAGSLAVA